MKVWDILVHQLLLLVVKMEKNILLMDVVLKYKVIPFQIPLDISLMLKKNSLNNFNKTLQRNVINLWVFRVKPSPSCSEIDSEFSLTGCKRSVVVLHLWIKRLYYYWKELNVSEFDVEIKCDEMDILAPTVSSCGENENLILLVMWF